jgi:(R,R)-butanediol dehydrogenase/meso-butanediol dehydrogenase/diacetyl reductase
MTAKKTMLAAVFEGQGKLSLKKVAVPGIATPEDVLLQVEGAGICGTDVHILEVPPGHPATPGAILGHEYVARVLEVGEAVTHFKPGDRVVVAPNLYCGLCPACQQGRPNQCADFTTLGIYLNGGFAKYNVAPERALHKIADSVPIEDAVFTELLSCVVGGTSRVKLQPGESVAILGAGPVGLMFAVFFKAAGAGRIILSDIAPYRLKLAQDAGFDTVNAKEKDSTAYIRERTSGGADVVVDAVGALFSQAIDVAAVGGRVVLFGMNQTAKPAVSQYDITRKDLTVYGSFIGINTFPTTIKMLESGVLKPSVFLTHKLPLAEIEKGFAAMRAGQAIKVLILP